MKIHKKDLIRIIKEEISVRTARKIDDNEGNMAKKQLFKLQKYAQMLHDALEDGTELESWVQSKITLAADYIGKVKHHLEYELKMDIEGGGGCGEEPEMIDVSNIPAEMAVGVSPEPEFNVHEEET